MKRFISYPSTEQFNSIVRQVKRDAQFVSYNEDTKEVIIDKDAKMPTLTFNGTVKLHGTQGAVIQHSDGTIQFQSRKNIVTTEKDNAGFAFFCETHLEEFKNFFSQLREEYKDYSIAIYGEFCGGNIQKNVAINGLLKMFVIFGVKISPNNEDETAYWIDEKVLKCDSLNPEVLIKNINDFETYTIDIDFERPDIAINKMLELTTAVGDECPVGKALGKSGTGEGIVWKRIVDGNRIVFKTKDDRHSKGTGKVKTLKPVDEELENKKREFVNKYACTEGRLQQMWTEIVHSVHNGNENDMEMKDMGQFIRLVVNDTIKENSTEMLEMGLEPKTVNSLISKVAREFFKSKLNSF